MIVASPIGGPNSLQTFDFAPQSNDLSLQGRQGQIVARAGERQQPGQAFGLAERDDCFGEPLVLVC